MVGSAIPDIMIDPMAVEGFKQLGLSPALVPFVGYAKILGVLAILIPKTSPRLKEWAYAGLVFDLVGATYLIIAAGVPFLNWAFMALPLFLAAGSYFFYHKKLKLQHVKSQQPSTAAVNTFSGEVVLS
jgi:hypothetical protein